jgi:hypothetical protein
MTGPEAASVTGALMPEDLVRLRGCENRTAEDEPCQCPVCVELRLDIMRLGVKMDLIFKYENRGAAKAAKAIQEAIDGLDNGDGFFTDVALEKARRDILQVRADLAMYFDRLKDVEDRLVEIRIICK